MSGHSPRPRHGRLPASLLLVVGVLAPLGVLATPAQAADTASVSGTVTGAGGAPLENVEVGVYTYDAAAEEWWWAAGAQTDGSGAYAVTDLPAGTYRVGFDDFTDRGYRSEYWDDQPSVDQADDVAVADGASVTGVDARLARGATISGAVTDGTSGLPDVDVNVYDAGTDEWAGSATTGPDGTYTVTSLPAGSYKVGFDDFNGGHLSEFWDDQPDLATADPVVVAAEAEVTGINAALATPGKITGTVTGPTGAAVSGVEVIAYSRSDGFWDYVADGTSGADGSYRIDGLDSGTYRVGFHKSGFLSEYWNDKATVESADDIVVTRGATVSGKNAQLATPGKITGTVTAGAGGALLPGIRVTAYRDDGFGFEEVDEVTTTAGGAYQVGDLEPGTYRLEFSDPAGTYKREFWDDQPTLAAATDVTVAASQTVTGRNAVLATASHITGTVTGSGGAALPGIDVTVYSFESGWRALRTVTTTATGGYDVGGLEPGAYRLGFADDSGAYSDQYYDGVSIFGKSELVHVPLSSTVSGRNAQLTRSGTITGTVTDGRAGVAGIRVTAYELVRGNWVPAAFAQTDAAGKYALPGLRATTHRVSFRDLSGRFLAETWRDAADLRSGTDVAVPAGGSAVADAALAPAGHITGTVTGPGGPLPNASVRAYQRDGADWKEVARDDTDATGAFDVAGLPAGTYRLGYTHPQFLPEYYDDEPSLDAAADIVVGAGATVAGRNALLATRGSISGTVTNSTGTALGGIVVTAYRDLGFDSLAGSATTNAAGGYSVTGLVPGTYRIRFSDPERGFATEWYDDQVDRSGAAAVTVGASQAVTGVNASLAGGSTISGHVTGSGGAGVDDVFVDAYRLVGSSWTWEASGSTDSTGAYAITGLQAGTWRLEFEPFDEDHLGEFWDDKPTLDTATDIKVPAGGTVPDVDATLGTGGTISGTVTGSGAGPLEDVWVRAYQLRAGSWSPVASGFSNRTGDYQVRGLRPGTYRLQFVPDSGFQDEWWDDKATVDQAADITVDAGAAVDRDAVLARAGGIGGTVSDADGALPGIEVTAYALRSGTWVDVDEAETDADGHYVLGNLGTGTYRVGFLDPDGVHGREFWDDEPTIATASDIAVTAGSVVTGRDAVLAAGAQVSGFVTAPDGGSLTGAEVTIYQRVGSAFEALESEPSRDTGLYFFEGLAPGTYRLGVQASWAGYVDEYWNDKPTLASATDVVLAAGGAADGISFTVQKRGSISGTVTGPASQALTGISVTAYRNDGGTFAAIASTATGSGGGYTLSVPPGTYRIGFHDASGTYRDEYFDDATTLAGGTDVVVASGAGVTGRDAALAPSAKPAVVNTTAPSVSGTAKVGSPLRASDGAWTPADPRITYQWRADQAPITGATAATYVPTASDVGRTIDVVVTATKDGYTAGTATSARTAVVAKGTIAVTKAPAITGTPKVGKKLTVSRGTWTPAGVTLKLQWYAGTKPIARATGTTLKVSTALKGKALSVKVTASAPGYTGLVVRTKSTPKIT